MHRLIQIAKRFVVKAVSTAGEQLHDVHKRPLGGADMIERQDQANQRQHAYADQHRLEHVARLADDGGVGEDSRCLESEGREGLAEQQTALTVDLCLFERSIRLCIQHIPCNRGRDGRRRNQRLIKLINTTKIVQRFKEV